MSDDPLAEEFPESWVEAQHMSGEGREMLAEIRRLRSERDHWHTIAQAQAGVIRKQREGHR